MGDLSFNGIYPYIDPGTGGTITGTIAAVDKILSLAGNDTNCSGARPARQQSGPHEIPGEMLVTSRDRSKKLKSAGKSAQEAVAEKPFADLDPVWGKGVVNGNQWVRIVYLAP
jgi:cyclase